MPMRRSIARRRCSPIRSRSAGACGPRAIGGSQTTDGNAALGSNSTTQQHRRRRGRRRLSVLAGYACRLCARRRRHQFLRQWIGSGRSDLFQAGAFVRHKVGAAYVGRAGLWLAGHHHRSHRNHRRHRSSCAQASMPTRSRAGSKAATASSRRGWRRPDAICRRPVHDVRSAGLCRAGRSPARNTFALTYAAKDVTTPRSELGLRSDRSCAMKDGIFTLRGRAAWAHDFNTDRNVAADIPDAAGRVLRRQRRRAGARRRAGHRHRPR